MAPRPEGTDGSDHKYREKIESYYKSMPIWRAAGWLLLHLSVIPVTLKVIWAMIPYYLLDAFPDIVPFSMAALWVLANIAWFFARPATAREHLGLVKAANIFMVFGLAMHVVTFYKYYMMQPQQSYASRRIWKELHDERGWTGGYWLDALQSIEAMLDIMMFLAWGGAVFCLHSYIIRKMEVDKRLGVNKKKDSSSDFPLRALPNKPGPRTRRPGRS